MIQKFNGKDYEIVVASNVANGSTIVACRNKQGRVVMNACRLDSNGHKAFGAYEKDIPVDFINWFVDEANRRLREH